MVVRKTESRIPGGFLNALFLSQDAISSDENYVLISYLSSPLRKGEKRNYIKNTYVVFVNTEHVDEPPEYHWKIEFFTGEDIAPFHTVEKSTVIGVFSIDTKEITELQEKEFLKLGISVGIDGTTTTLEMTQDIIGLYPGIETLIEDENDEGIAKGGNPYTSRLVANEYRDYIVNCAGLVNDEGELVGVPVNLLTAVIYLYLFYNPLELTQNEYELWEEYINDGNISNDLKRIPLGISQIKPHFLSMFLKKNDGTDRMITDLQVWDENSVSKEKYEKDVFTRFHDNASQNEKIDILNLLRFPKSSVYLCYSLLKNLKERHGTWKDFTPEEVLNDKKCVQTIVSEYENGPCVKISKLSAVGEKTFFTIGAPYIQSIAKSFKQYIIKIKDFDNVPQHLQQTVLDIIRDAFQDVRGVVFVYDQNQMKFQEELSFVSEPTFIGFGWASQVFVAAMQLMRLALPEGGCEPPFEDSPESLGSHIGNTAVHELAHLLGLSYAYEGANEGGHVPDTNNYMWDAPFHPDFRQGTRVNDGVFEYLVKEGDTLSSIVNRWKSGQLHPCARGFHGLSDQMVWEDPDNAEFGFIAHPTKSDAPGRIANDPNYIYPGERVSLKHHNFRTQEYRRYFPGWLGQKSFNNEQIRIMNEVVQERI